MIRSFGVPLAVKVGGSKPVSVQFDSLPSLPNGSYHFIVRVTDGRGDVTTISTPLAYPLHAPFQSLIPSLPSLVTAKDGTGTFTFTVTNVGNVTSTGTAIATLKASTNGTLVGAPTVGSVPSRLALGVQKPHKFTVKLSAAQVTELKTATLASLEITDSTGVTQTLLLHL